MEVLERKEKTLAGQRLVMELRKCAGGCDQTFWAMEGSETDRARSDCSRACHGLPLSRDDSKKKQAAGLFPKNLKERKTERFEVIHGVFRYNGLSIDYNNRPNILRMVEEMSQRYATRIELDEICKIIYGNDCFERIKGRRLRADAMRYLKEARRSLEKNFGPGRWLVEVSSDKTERKIQFHEKNLKICVDNRAETQKPETTRAEPKEGKAVDAAKSLARPAQGEAVKEIDIDPDDPAQRYLDCVRRAQKHVQAMNSHRIAIARLACEACEIKRGGGAHWDGFAHYYTLRQFAEDIGVNKKTLYMWTEVYRYVVQKLPAGVYEENDYKAARKAIDRVGKEASQKELKEAFDREKERNHVRGAGYKIEQIIKNMKTYLTRARHLDFPECPREEIADARAVAAEMYRVFNQALEEKDAQNG